MGWNIYPPIMQYSNGLDHKSLDWTKNLRGSKHSSQAALILFSIIFSLYSISVALQHGRVGN